MWSPETQLGSSWMNQRRETTLIQMRTKTLLHTHIHWLDSSTKSVQSSELLLRNIWIAFWKLSHFFSGNQSSEQNLGYLPLMVISHRQKYAHNFQVNCQLQLSLELTKSTNEIGMRSFRLVKSYLRELFMKEYRETELSQRYILTLLKLLKKEQWQ